MGGIMKKEKKYPYLIKKEKYEVNGKYFDVTQALNEDCNVYLIYGGRNNGKSFQIKETCISEACTGNEFIYLRRLEKEVKAKEVERYFPDMNIQMLTNEAAEQITCYGNEIYFSKLDIDTLRMKRLKKIGYSMFLSGYKSYMSLSYPNVTTIIFEEFFAKKEYNPDEVKELDSILSTVFRGRKGKLFLLGNPETKVNPHLEAWGLTKQIANQKNGVMSIWQINGKLRLCAVRVPNIVESEMILSNEEKINKGLWDVEDLPEIRDYYYIHKEKIVRVIYDSTFTFSIDKWVNLDNGKSFVTVHTIDKKKIENIKCDYIINPDKPKFDLVFGIYNNMDNFSWVIDAIKENNTLYQSKECGTDFKACLRKDGFLYD